MLRNGNRISHLTTLHSKVSHGTNRPTDLGSGLLDEGAYRVTSTSFPSGWLSSRQYTSSSIWHHDLATRIVGEKWCNYYQRLWLYHPRYSPVGNTPTAGLKYPSAYL